jgi:hypothetical protein
MVRHVIDLLRGQLAYILHLMTICPESRKVINQPARIIFLNGQKCYMFIH